MPCGAGLNARIYARQTCPYDFNTGIWPSRFFRATFTTPSKIPIINGRELRVFFKKESSQRALPLSIVFLLQLLLEASQRAPPLGICFLYNFFWILLNAPPRSVFGSFTRPFFKRELALEIYKSHSPNNNEQENPLFNKKPPFAPLRKIINEPLRSASFSDERPRLTFTRCPHDLRTKEMSQEKRHLHPSRLQQHQLSHQPR